jgi:hypothetical protein
MAGSKFDPNLFFQVTDNAALHVPAAELFGFLSRALDMPSSWAALLHRNTGDHVVVSAGGVVEGDDLEDVLFVRVTPIEVTCEETGIISRDQFACRANVRLRVVVVPERSEMLSFQQQVLGSHRVVQARRIAQYLQPAIRTGLARYAAKTNAADAVGAQDATSATSTLIEALQGPCFEAGLVLDGAPSVRFESGTLRQVQDNQQKAAVREAEHEAAQQLQAATERAQAEHLDHLTSLLGRLTQLTTSSPDVKLPELIRTFVEHERGELYQALFASQQAAQRTQWIVVAAGDELLFFDANSPGDPTRRLKITGDAGPVRSVHAVTGADGKTHLWLGASTGVYRWPIDATAPDLTLLVKNAPDVQGGFNATAMAGDRVFASHSELGLCAWDLAQPTSGQARFESMTRGVKAVRGVRIFDGHLYCAIDDRIICWLADDHGDQPRHIYTGSTTTIASLCPTDVGLLAGNGNGDILYWKKSQVTRPERLHAGVNRAAESLWMASTNGVRRIVYTDTSLHVHAQVLGDSFSCRYEAGGQTLRRVELAPDMLVATNDLRDRLICWTPGQPAHPIATIGVARLTGRSVQDVCLVSESKCPPCGPSRVGTAHQQT